jgi:hypothetical protein
MHTFFVTAMLNGLALTTIAASLYLLAGSISRAYLGEHSEDPARRMLEDDSDLRSGGAHG